MRQIFKRSATESHEVLSGAFGRGVERAFAGLTVEDFAGVSELDEYDGDWRDSRRQGRLEDGFDAESEAFAGDVVCLADVKPLDGL